MKVTSLQNTHSLVEFHHYIDNVKDDELISIVELLIESNDTDSIETEFSNTFAVETNNQSYIFSNYKVSEYYIVGDNFIKVICVK